ncbi:MAG TPA: hypothetical protein VMA98_03395 [Candidatus Acidoferrales bacterium]|nr:hypothetical protein [Candidatus Acidoferrales bacterium]
MKISAWLPIVAAAALAFGLAVSARASTSDSASPLEKLNVWVGRWTLAEESRETPYSHAFSISWGADCSWMPNQSYMICDFESDGVDPAAGGVENNLSLFTYSTSDRAYHHMGITRDAKPLFEKMDVIGDIWTDRFELPYKGKILYCRDVYTFTSPSSYTHRFEISDDQGSSWTLVSTAVATKSQ